MNKIHYIRIEYLVLHKVWVDDDPGLVLCVGGLPVGLLADGLEGEALVLAVHAALNLRQRTGL